MKVEGSGHLQNPDNLTLQKEHPALVDTRLHGRNAWSTHSEEKYSTPVRNKIPAIEQVIIYLLTELWIKMIPYNYTEKCFKCMTFYQYILVLQESLDK
jgi:hypothetical protein